jgi:hypothetical protein
MHMQVSPSGCNRRLGDVEVFCCLVLIEGLQRTSLQIQYFPFLDFLLLSLLITSKLLGSC